MSMTDINIDRGYPAHRKTKRLLGLCGPEADIYPIRLWCYCALYHAADGKMVDYSPAEVEAAVGWRGETGVLLAGLLKVGFLESLNSGQNGYACHDWIEYESHISKFAAKGKAMNDAKYGRTSSPVRTTNSTPDRTPVRNPLPNLPILPTEGVPSIGIESKTETKTPPTQSNNKGAGKLIRSMDGSDVCCTRFDLWPEDGQRSSNRAPEPQPVATHGRRWVWDSSSLCWYAETLNDSRVWFCGFTSVEWARISFDRQKQIESEFGDDGEANRAHAMQLYYAEARRRDKIREDANGNTHGKAKPDSHRKFFK